jgi:RNA polymerase sigma-70 factor (ECF subfamily)
MTTNQSNIDNDLLRRARDGDREALGKLFTQYRPRLRQMIRLRLDRRLQGRVDPSDVLQETFIDVCGRSDEYFKKEKMPFFLWLRSMAGRRLTNTHREHLGTQMRDAGHEVSLYAGALPQATSLSLAAQLVGRLTSVSHAAMRAELQLRLQEVLNGMEPIDREVLALRHFEELSNNETAEVLGIHKAAASNRYTRAMTRLYEILAGIPGLLEQ